MRRIAHPGRMWLTQLKQAIIALVKLNAIPCACRKGVDSLWDARCRACMRPAHTKSMAHKLRLYEALKSNGANNFYGALTQWRTQTLRQEACLVACKVESGKCSL